MMNNKAQMELNPGAVLMAVIGFFLAIWMSNRMEASIGLTIMTVIVTTVVCYVMASFILNQ